MQNLGAPQLRAELASAINDGDDGIRLFAAALASPMDTESTAITLLRERLDSHPAARGVLTRSFHAAGMSSLEAYRTSYPPRFSPSPPATGNPVQPRDACSNPHLRVRVARLTVIEEDDDFANDTVYCLFAAETASGGELRVTPKTSPLDEGDSRVYSLAEGLFWGQAGKLRATGGNMLITYNCFESESEDGIAELLDVIADSAEAFGNSNGWAVGVGGLAQILMKAVALDKDDHLLTDQHSIVPSVQVEASNGVYWTVQKSGTNLNSDWNWSLRIEAWGCAEG